MTAAAPETPAKPRRKIIRPNYRDHSILRWSYDEAQDFSGFTRGSLWTMASRRQFVTYKHGFFRVDRVSFENYLCEKK